MSVKAKFTCVKAEPYSYDGGKTTAGKNITMNAVVRYGNDDTRFDENESWSQATPSGQLLIHISNPAAFDQFEVGKYYYLTFEPVEGAVKADDAGGSNPPGPGQPGKP